MDAVVAKFSSNSAKAVQNVNCLVSQQREVGEFVNAMTIPPATSSRQQSVRHIVQYNQGPMSALAGKC